MRLTLLFTLIFIATATHAQDLIKDGDMESEFAVGITWEGVWGQFATGVVIQSNAEAHGGTYSCKITTDNTTNPDYTGIKQEISPQNNTEYLLTFWIKGAIPSRTDGEVEASPLSGGNSESMGVDAKNNATPITPDNGEFVITPGTYNNWTQVNYYWNSKSDYGGFLVDMGSYDNSTSVYYIDDVSCLPAGATAIEDGWTGTITQFELFQNYPNPFNPNTTIRFAVPEKSDVKIQVFDQLGQMVKQVLYFDAPAGYHEAKIDGSDLASGVYIYRLEAEGFVASRKMMLVK